MNACLRWIGVAAIGVAGLGPHTVFGQQYAPYQPQQAVQATLAGYPSTGQPAVTAVGPSRSAAPAAAYPVAVGATQGMAAQAATPPVLSANPLSPSSPAAYGYAASVAPAAMTSPAPRYPQTAAQIPVYSYPQMAQAPTYGAASGAGYSTYPQVAQQASPPEPVGGESMPAPTPAAPDQSMPSAVDKLHSGAAATNGAESTYPSSGYPSGGGYAGYGPSQCGYTGYGVAEACEAQCGGHTWFGGVYALGMERDNPSVRKLTVRVNHDTAADPYYPQANTTVLSTYNTDFDYEPGVEVRFGATFGGGSTCDTGCGYGYGTGCGNGCSPGCGCAPDQYAWEVGWWGIDEDKQRAVYWDPSWADNIRCYGMVNFVGLEIDPDGDAMWSPVNSYYGYGLPIPAPNDPPVDGDIIILAQQARQYFSAQNLELNLIHFPMCGMGCGGCGTGCGYGACGGGGCGCEPACTPVAFSMYGLCGVRWFRIDDDFYYCSEYGQWFGGGYDQESYDGFSGDNANELFYNIQVDNNLVGPQLGWNMNYCVGCRWNFFMNSTFGIFNNHIQQKQRLWAGGGGGTARFAQTGDRFDLKADKDDVSFLGELRLGGSYDVTCNWRAVLAYRAVAITGVANSVDQIPTDFTSRQYVQMIDSDSSIIIHGVQGGVECRY